jgi:glucose-6-phosphate isomerase
MISKRIKFNNFNSPKPHNKNSITKFFKKLLKEYSSGKNDLLNSMSKKYIYSFNFKKVNRFKNFLNYNIFGMGGSSLGAESIYSFLNSKIKKKFTFIDNIKYSNKLKSINSCNLIISKSGNTLETISNFHSQNIKKNCIFITEKNKSYLRSLALKMKSEIIDHNNFIGGRYSVLSETGMLPAFLMGLNPNKFKQFDNIIKNKKFLKSLVNNVGCLLTLHKRKKTNSIILNFDEDCSPLFLWYQQLVAESLGKKTKGILPIISNVPKDNHSLMQLYLDGKQNNFFTFFYTKNTNSKKISFKKFKDSNYDFIKNKNMEDIRFAQFKATQNVFKRKKIPFRTFIIGEKNEETLGELFIFFILETILLGKALKIDPFNQPAVELIKKDTFKILKN